VKVLRNDTVVIVTGKDRGKRGRVRAVLPKENRVIVEGLNIYKRHLKRGRARQTGIIEFEAPIQASNVMVVCTNCDQPTRVGYDFQDDGTKIRICKQCDQAIGRQVQ
jgi:large subunit ribosomal protein L24